MVASGLDMHFSTSDGPSRRADTLTVPALSLTAGQAIVLFEDHLAPMAKALSECTAAALRKLQQAAIYSRAFT
jgi:hypothetical protein